MNKKSQTFGAIITLIAGIFWGFSGTCGQYLIESFNYTPSHITSIRMLGAGSILAIMGFIQNPQNMKDIWKTRKQRIALLIFSFFGILFSQFTYMMAVKYTNSGTATILQYIGPVLIMIVSCFMLRRLPTKIELIAIIMAVLGTFFIATHGNLNTMIINPQGLIWGLLAAVALMMYNMIPLNLMKSFGSIPVASYGMIIGGIFIAIYSKAWTMPIYWTPSFFLAIGAMVILGTVITFALYLAGVSICGPVKASMLSSIEPVSATVLMVVWLKVPIHPMEIVGFLCIFVTIFLLTKKS